MNAQQEAELRARRRGARLELGRERFRAALAALVEDSDHGGLEQVVDDWMGTDCPRPMDELAKVLEAIGSTADIEDLDRLTASIEELIDQEPEPEPVEPESRELTLKRILLLEERELEIVNCFKTARLWSKRGFVPGRLLEWVEGVMRGEEGPHAELIERERNASQKVAYDAVNQAAEMRRERDEARAETERVREVLQAEFTRMEHMFVLTTRERDDARGRLAEALDTLLELARHKPVTKEERDMQRLSFAYGNANLSNPRITRESIRQAAEKIAATGLTGAELAELDESRRELEKLVEMREVETVTGVLSKADFASARTAT